MRPRAFSLFHSPKPFSLYTALFSTQSPQLIKDTNTLQNHQSHTQNTHPFHYLKAFSALSTTLSQNPRNFKALSALDSLLTQTHHFDFTTSVFAIHCLSQLKKLGRAKAVLYDLRNTGKVSDYFLYNLVIDCLVKDAKINDVEIVWNEICGFEELSKIRRIDVSDYVIYVCRFGGACEIRSVFERILMGCGVLKEQSYVALIGALCRVNEGLLAKEVVREMYDVGYVVDDLTYFVMFQCFCRNGDLDEADLILKILVKRKYHLDICVYGHFMLALCKLGKFREANKLFRKLIQRDCSGNFKNDENLKERRRVIFQLNCEGAVPEMMAYEMYFRSLCNVGKLDEAEALLKKMMKKRVVPEICVYGSFIKALFRADRDQDAIKFFNVERKKGIARVGDIARFIIMGLCKKGKVDDALRIFDEVLMRAGSVSCTSILNYMLDSYWKLGRFAEAESLFERSRDGCFGQPDMLIYTIMVNEYCKKGDVSKALCLFEELLTSNIGFDGSLYEIIIKELCARGRVKEAHKCLNDMIQDGHIVFFTKWKLLFKLLTREEHGISFGL